MRGKHVLFIVIIISEMTGIPRVMSSDDHVARLVGKIKRSGLLSRKNSDEENKMYFE